MREIYNYKQSFFDWRTGASSLSPKGLASYPVLNSMEQLACIPADEVENNQVENLHATPISNSGKSQLKNDEFWPLSGKPYFSVLVSPTHINPRCQLYLPVKICEELPSGCVPVALTCCGKIWGTHYLGDQRRLEITTWRTFVIDNELEAGDVCVFELEESNKDSIRFRVQILRGRFPPELEDRVNGETLLSLIRIARLFCTFLVFWRDCCTRMNLYISIKVIEIPTYLL